MKLIQSIYLPTVIFALLFTSACGDSDSTAVTSTKLAAANLDGTYKLTSFSCTVGKTNVSVEQAPSVTIQGANFVVTTQDSATCTETQSFTLTDLTSNSMTTIDGATTCASSCSGSECIAEAATNKKESNTFTLVNGVLTVTDSVHDDNLCSDPKGLMVEVWSK